MFLDVYSFVSHAWQADSVSSKSVWRRSHLLYYPHGSLETLLSTELAADEQRWTDFSLDELSVKENTAESLLQFLLDETVGILTGIENWQQALLAQELSVDV